MLTVSRRFTFLDLLVTLFLVLAIGTFAITRAAKDKETDNRVRCASNLHMIGEALRQYASDNDGAYPRTSYDPEKADQLVAYSNAKAQPTAEEKNQGITASFCKAGPGPNDVTAPMFLLLTTQKLKPVVFLCPAAPAATTQPIEPADPESQCNFLGREQLGYSFMNMYPSQGAAHAGYRTSLPMNSNFAVAADMNPGCDELLIPNIQASDPKGLKKINSQNHGGEDENVLFADGHVEVVNTPYTGVDRDNIYTYGRSGIRSVGDGIIGSPASDKDSILLPTAKQGKTENRASKVEDGR